MTLFESLLSLLAEAGVRHIFGVPGDALNPLTDALRKQDRIRWCARRTKKAPRSPRAAPRS